MIEQQISLSFKTAIASIKAGMQFQQQRKTERPRLLDKIGREIKVDSDYALEDILISALRASSQWPILSEESPQFHYDSDFLWVIDPLDGSLNYLRDIPHYCISVGLCRGSEPVLGVVADLVTGDVYSGVIGQGAWLNNVPIQVSKTADRSDAILCTGFPAAFDFDSDTLSLTWARYREFLKVRMFGSAAASLAYIASGCCDSYWEERVKIWDVAAGLALVKAAGGVISMSDWNSDFSLTAGAASCETTLPQGMPKSN